jgi:NAD(P)H-hydrate epimerase
LNLQSGPEAFRRRRAPTILTPHPGEAGRLLGRSIRDVQADRPAAAAELARRSRSVVVLKGAPTLTADPSGMLWCNGSGSPALAKGGTGDVLTGIAASFLAQGLEVSDAAVAAVFVHGLAGEAAGEASGERGALASEVADAVGRVLAALE